MSICQRVWIVGWNVWGRTVQRVHRDGVTWLRASKRYTIGLCWSKWEKNYIVLIGVERAEDTAQLMSQDYYGTYWRVETLLAEFGFHRELVMKTAFSAHHWHAVAGAHGGQSL